MITPTVVEQLNVINAQSSGASATVSPKQITLGGTDFASVNVNSDTSTITLNSDASGAKLVMISPNMEKSFSIEVTDAGVRVLANGILLATL